ncbi:MAG: acylphosphatase [Deltaproteobacteria bacterium]
MTEAIERAELVVTGRVQGVFFRQSALGEAQRLGLVGFVRNLADGSVESVVEGPAHAVLAYEEWCRKGPLFAKVAGVQVKRSAPRGEFRTFTVER